MTCWKFYKTHQVSDNESHWNLKLFYAQQVCKELLKKLQKSLKFVRRRQRDRVVRAPALKSGGRRGLKYELFWFSVFVSLTPWSPLYKIANWSASFQLGFLSTLCSFTLYLFHHLFPLALKTPMHIGGEWSFHYYFIYTVTRTSPNKSLMI